MLDEKISPMSAKKEKQYVGDPTGKGFGLVQTVTYYKNRIKPDEKTY